MNEHDEKRVLGEKHVEIVEIRQFIPPMSAAHVHSREWGKCPVIGWVWRYHQEWKDGHRLRAWDTFDAVALSSAGAFVVEDALTDDLYIED